MVTRFRKTAPTVRDVIVESGNFLLFISGSLLNGVYGELNDLEKAYAHKLGEVIECYEKCCEVYDAKVPMIKEEK